MVGARHAVPLCIIVLDGGARTGMTPLQRFRLVMLGLVSVCWMAMAVLYFLDGTHGSPAFIFGLVAIPLLAVPLWYDIRQTDAGKSVPVLTLERERRPIHAQVLMIAALLVVPIIVGALIMFYRSP